MLMPASPGRGGAKVRSAASAARYGVIPVSPGEPICVHSDTKLPLEVISAGRTIDDCSPDQLALLLAFGVRRDGGRAAILRQNNGAVSVELFIPREN